MFFGTLTPPFRGRPVHSRVQVFFKIEAGALAEKLPEKTRPRAWRGENLGELRFSRLDAGRALLRPLSGRTDHFSCRFAVDMETPDGLQPGTWVFTRKTSSWFEAVYDNVLLGSGYKRSRFLVTDEANRFDLLIADDGGAEVKLSAEAVERSCSILFPSARAVQEFLGSTHRLQPFDSRAPEGGDDPPVHLALEPLLLHELEARAFEAFPAGSITVDSAWRWVAQRRVFASETAFESRDSTVPAT